MRQRVLMFGADVDEVDVEPVDVRDELRQGVQLRLDLAPVVFGLPIAREFPHRRQLHALGAVTHCFLFGPTRGGDAPAEVVERSLRDLDAEGADRIGSALERLSRDRRAVPGGLLRGRGHGRCQRHGCRQEHDEESRGPAKDVRDISLDCVACFLH